MSRAVRRGALGIAALTVTLLTACTQTTTPNVGITQEPSAPPSSSPVSSASASPSTQATGLPEVSDAPVEIPEDATTPSEVPEKGRELPIIFKDCGEFAGVAVDSWNDATTTEEKVNGPMTDIEGPRAAGPDRQQDYANGDLPPAKEGEPVTVLTCVGTSVFQSGKTQIVTYSLVYTQDTPSAAFVFSN